MFNPKNNNLNNNMGMDKAEMGLDAGLFSRQIAYYSMILQTEVDEVKGDIAMDISVSK